MVFNNTVAILGAGFSTAARAPSTRELTEHFLNPPTPSATPEFLQPIITKHLLRFWETVFGYSVDKSKPSFEDHFTLLDLAANSGHNLGREYSPSMLRAIRRISIHRVFDVLDQFQQSDAIRDFVSAFRSGRDNCFISTNWDIVLENHANELFHYGLNGRYLDGPQPGQMVFQS